MISTMATSSGLQAVSFVFFCNFSPAQKARMLKEMPKNGEENISFMILSSCSSAAWSAGCSRLSQRT